MCNYDEIPSFECLLIDMIYLETLIEESKKEKLNSILAKKILHWILKKNLFERLILIIQSFEKSENFRSGYYYA